MNHTIKSVNKMVDQAQRDLVILARLHRVLEQVPVKLMPDDYGFLISNYPIPKGKDPIPHWRELMNLQVEAAKQSIAVNTKWLQSKADKPFRCALPKKQQRKLGLLPPV
jgi:hypothetical protein